LLEDFAQNLAAFYMHEQSWWQTFDGKTANLCDDKLGAQL
jgi:hypothetical protein